MKIHQVYEFARELEKLKTIQRKSDTLDGRYENSAEHSWQAALVAMQFEQFYPEQVDINLVIKMLLVHDLGEIYAGDTWVFDDEGKSNSFERERESLKKVVSMLDDQQQEEIIELWTTFEQSDDHDAKYARVIDALIALINLYEVSDEGYNPYHLSKTQVVRKKIFIQEDAPLIWELAEEIIEKCVEKGLLKDE
ncbi:HD domain-containing protein [Macrococcoides caseolyticum]|uniref:HD domain-containing protein n=1 Tax=Macrococcoides caseolyticum TaxID=69966 RepID=UPI001F29D0AF|nr:HD domain-containing protein [Macrococcus caseolyticus]MCE4957354.1 HD domain-containing protein [Macrococcus caseolyticus]